MPGLKRTGNLDYIGSVVWTGKRYSSWNNWVHGNRKVSVRSDGRKGKGKESLPLGERCNCSLLSPCQFTHPQKVRHKQAYSTVQLEKPSSLAADRSSYSSGLDRDKDQTSLISPRKLWRHLDPEQLVSEKVSFFSFSCLIKWMKSCAQGWNWCGRQSRMGQYPHPPPPDTRTHTHTHTTHQAAIFPEAERTTHLYSHPHLGIETFTKNRAVKANIYSTQRLQPAPTLSACSACSLPDIRATASEGSVRSSSYCFFFI